MNNLIKPQKQSYTGVDSKVVAYSVACEIAWGASLCTAGAVIVTLYSWSPIAVGVGLGCGATYLISSAICHGYI